MNCANHPEIPVEEYCQQCGKALCSQCVRPVAVMDRETCLAARLTPLVLSIVSTLTTATSNTRKRDHCPQLLRPIPQESGLAAILGPLPAWRTYNGQFKAIVHGGIRDPDYDHL